MKSEIDQLLQQTLSPSEEPDRRLNQKILQKAEEAEKMKRQNKKRVSAALVAAATLMIGSIGVFAAWKYMSPDQVAQELQDGRLAEAFQGEDAIQINETQEYGGYKITLLGIVFGKSLSQYMMSDEQGIREDRSYIVTAIENVDGTPRPSVSDEAYGNDPFCVSPLIGGLTPGEYNVITMNGGYSEDVIDGIQYRIVECDNVEIFADRGLYLSVNDGAFFESSAYQMDPVTGVITRNESYDGVNALFRLPIDASKADPAAAESYIRDLWADEGTDAPEDQPLDEENPYAAREATINSWTAEDFTSKAELLESQTLTVDNDGMVSYQYFIDGDEWAASIAERTIFEEGQTGFSDYRSYAEHRPDCAYVETFTKNEDGSITFQLWKCPDGQDGPTLAS